jgi:hypothetical protein
VPQRILSQYFTITVSRLRAEVLEQKIFQNDELLNELYISQRKNLTMSLPNFKEVFILYNNQECYFQHRYIFQGRNFCNVDFPHFVNSVTPLRKALQMKQTEYTNIRAVYNSCLYYANNFFEESKKTEKLQAISSMFDLFDLNIYMNF